MNMINLEITDPLAVIYTQGPYIQYKLHHAIHTGSGFSRKLKFGSDRKM